MQSHFESDGESLFGFELSEETFDQLREENLSESDRWR